MIRSVSFLSETKIYKIMINLPEVLTFKDILCKITMKGRDKYGKNISEYYRFHLSEFEYI